MPITTADIQALRQQTGVGLMDAKKALEAVDGDIQQAIEHLRKAGQKIAGQKSQRAVKDGYVGVWTAPDGSAAAILALACETDFVARTEDFHALANTLAATLGASAADQTAESFQALLGPGQAATVAEYIQSTIAKLGENIQVVGLGQLRGAPGSIDTYLHANGKVAAAVALVGGPDELRHDLALQVAALNPTYARPEDVPADVIASESAIYREQLLAEGKPAAMIDKILPGKLQKFYRDVCLIEQPFVKDDAQSIRQLMAADGLDPSALVGYRRVAI